MLLINGLVLFPRLNPMYEYNIEIKRWIDGDTVDAVVDLGFFVSISVRFRIMEIDAPERGEQNFRKATDAANKLYPPGTKIVVETKKSGSRDKYGRWLISLPELAKILVEQNLLKPVPQVSIA